MASIQILEISPVETPMEDLSDDATGNITGGFLGEQLDVFLDKLYAFVQDVLGGCNDGTYDSEICDRII
ncbi:MAG: hypothetical protein AB4206_12030 [Xenococcaceae cyanobacterium]